MGAAILHSNHSAHFVVIDKEIIWYSDMDFLEGKKDGLSDKAERSASGKWNYENCTGWTAAKYRGWWKDKLMVNKKSECKIEI